MVPTGGVTDQATPALSLAPLARAVKDAVWPESRETDEGVTERVLWATFGVTERAPVAIPGINVTIAIPVWKELVVAFIATV